MSNPDAVPSGSPTRFRPGAGVPGARSGEGAFAPPAHLLCVGSRRALAWWVFREQTVANSTTWNAECRTRTLFRPARRPGSAPVRGSGGAEWRRAVRPAGAFRPCRAPASAAAVGIPRANRRKINDLERQVSNSDAVPPCAPTRFRSGAGIRGRGAAKGARAAGAFRSAPGPGERRRSGYSEGERSWNQRLGAPSVELGCCSARLAGPVPPRCRYPGARSGEGRLPRRCVPSVSPRRAPPQWVFREQTVAKSTTWNAKCRIRTLFRPVRRPGSAPVRVSGDAERRRGAHPAGAFGPRRAPESAGAVGVPRANGRKINGLERRMSNSDGVPLRPPTRSAPGLGECRRSGYSEIERSRNQRFGTRNVELALGPLPAGAGPATIRGLLGDSPGPTRCRRG